jgi:hypothetical protein
MLAANNLCNDVGFTPVMKTPSLPQGKHAKAALLAISDNKRSHEKRIVMVARATSKKASTEEQSKPVPTWSAFIIDFSVCAL